MSLSVYYTVMPDSILL